MAKTQENQSYEVEQRISKMFLDPGSAGSVSVVSGEPRDVAPTWIGDGTQQAHTYSGDDNAGPIADSALTGIATDEGQLTNNLQISDSATDLAGGDGFRQE